MMQATSTIHSFHAHIYYDPITTRAAAAELRDEIATRFQVQLGRWHEHPIGPHPAATYQVAFAPELFASIVPWLMLNRRGLTVLLHPNTGRPRDDHAIYPIWMGAMLPLKLDILPETSATHDPIVPNTTQAEEGRR
jgi:aromatic ring-cleaving dioxygenase